MKTFSMSQFPLFILFFLIYYQPSNSADATVSVSINTTYQTIEGWGGFNRWEGYRVDNRPRASALQATNLIGEVPFNVMGIGANFFLWEQSNDNGDPASFNWASFNNVQKVPEYFGGLKTLGIGITVLDIGNIPAWWNSASDDEIVESIAAMLVYTRDHQNTMVTYLSYANATPALIAKAGSRFTQLGLSTKWIVSGTPANVEIFLKDMSIAKQLGPVGYLLRNEFEPNSTLAALSTLAEKYSKSVWYLSSIVYGEYSVDGDPHGEYYDINQWFYAWRTLVVYFNNLKYGRSACNLYVDFAHPLMGGWDPAAVRAPVYSIFKQLVSAFPVGNKVIDALSSDGAIWSLASQQGKYFNLALVNSNTSPKIVDISGLPNGVYSTVLTDSTHKMSLLNSQSVTAGKTTITLSAHSLTTLLTSDGTTKIRQSSFVKGKVQCQFIENVNGQVIRIIGADGRIRHHSLNISFFHSTK